MRRRGYTEIRTPERVSVRNFLDQSPAYKAIVLIPQVKLSATNQKILENICDPLSFNELEAQLYKFSHATDLGGKASGVLQFFTAFIDDNQNFEYQMLQLKDEYLSWTKKCETTPLL